MPAKYPHVVKAEKYAKDVVEGRLPACEWVILACKRHLDEKEKSKSRAFKYRFDREKAERICKFAERMPHIKGSKFVGKKIELQGWQCFFYAVGWGWLRKDTGLRRFRRLLLVVPRKNAKSTMAALAGLYMLVADNEAGAEVYSGATSELQAFEVFRPAKLMVEKSPDFQAYFGVMAGARSITQLRTNSFFKTLIGKPGDGASPHCSIHDEYHEHATDEQVDTMLTGMGARQQPLQLMITTSGDNISGPCYKAIEDAQNVLKGTREDDELFAVIYTVDKDDDWASPEALRKANPNFGVSVDAEFLLSMQSQAIQTPRKQAVFKTKHLNIWVGAMNAYFDVVKWRACKKEGLKLDDFIGKRCFLALDAASKVDLNALDLIFPMEDGDYATFTKYYMPEETLQRPDYAHLREWKDEGWITATDGEIIDFEVIRDDIIAFSSMFQCEELAYDPWQATQLALEVQKNGGKVIEYRQQIQTMTEPMKTLDALMRSGRMIHDGNPVTTWCIGNVVSKTDRKDNVYPEKSRMENKIDGAVAKIMNIGRILVSGDKPKEPSIFFV